MEKPGLEPPPPAFPNKGLIEAGPAPGCTEPSAAGAPLGAEEPRPWCLHRAGWQQLLQSSPVSPPAAGWGSLSRGSVLGSTWGLSEGSGDGWPQVPHTGSLVPCLSCTHPELWAGGGTTVQGGPSHVCATVLGNSRAVLGTQKPPLPWVFYGQGTPLCSAGPPHSPTGSRLPAGAVKPCC